MDQHTFKTMASANRRAFIRKSALTMTGAATLIGGLKSVASPQQLPEAKLHTLRFAVASDGHFGQPDTPFQKMHQEMMGWLNEEVNGKGLDFVVFNGDLIHDNPEFLPQVKQQYERLECPYFCTRGNHDQVSDELWEQTWGYGLNHVVEKDEYVLLLGDTSNQKGEYVCADTKWLGEQFKKFSNKKYIFVFLHISQRKWTSAGIDCPEVTALLEKTPNVSAVFHGHDHHLDHEFLSGGLPYFFDGHIGGNWGAPYRGYRIVEVQKDGKIRTYQCNPQAFYVNNSVHKSRV